MCISFSVYPMLKYVYVENDRFSRYFLNSFHESAILELDNVFCYHLSLTNHEYT